MRLTGVFARGTQADPIPAQYGPEALLHSGSCTVRMRAGIEPASSPALVAAIAGRPRWTDPELAAIAEQSGHARALVEGYARHGRSVLGLIQGSFSLAVAEPARDSLLLAIDRVGIETLAYWAGPDMVRFGSDLDALFPTPGAAPALSHQGIFDYLYTHVVPSSRTIYEGCRKLKPAEFVHFQEGQEQRGFYWEAPYAEPDNASLEAASRELERELEQAVRRALTADPTGVFLSGGLDSSTVTGMVARIRGGGATDAYGIGFAAEGYDEMGYARIAARHFGVRLHEYYVTQDDVVHAVPLVAKAYDEPFGNASAVPAYYCARMAAGDGKRMLLAGDGGDEIFGGNARYAKQMVFAVYERAPAPLRSLAHALAGVPGARRLAPVRKLGSYIEQAQVPMPDRLEAYNFLHRFPIERMFTPDFLATIDPAAPLADLREVYFRARSPEMLKRMLHLDLKVTLADSDLRKVTRMCDLAGVDVAFPMLDESLVEFAARIPSRWLLRRYQLRWFYKHALRNFLPQETIAKTKHGFGLPFGVWMTTHRPLQELALDSIGSLKRRGWLKPEWLDELIDQHRSGHASYYGVMVWVLMMLQQWLEAHGR